MLYNKIKEKEFKEYFEIMIEEMDRVNSILQEFNTIGKNKKETNRSRHNLKTIIKSMIPLLEADAVFQSKTIKFDLRDTSDLLVNGDEIRQLILNLTRNALESMDQNGSVLVKTYNRNGKSYSLFKTRARESSRKIWRNWERRFSAPRMPAQALAYSLL